MNDDRHGWTDFAASFALDALDDDDRNAFEAHLASCLACRIDANAYREVVGVLGNAVPLRTAPAQLRERVLAEARAARPLPLAKQPESAHRSDRAERRALRTRGPWLAVAAAVLLAIAAFAAYAAQRSLLTDLEQRLAAAEQRASDADTELDRLAISLAERDSLLAAALDPTTRTSALVAEGQPPSVRLYWNRARGRVIIAAADLQPAADGRTYQLWGIATGSDPVSLGTFNTGDDGRALVSLAVDPAIDFSVTAVSEEPAGGSPQPTTQPFLIGNFSQ